MTGLAYLLMPVATIPLVGSFAAPSLLTQLPEVSSLTWLRLEPVAAAATIGAGGNQITNSGISELGISAATFTGAGFWLALIGAIAAFLGAAVELDTSRKQA